MSQFSKLRQNGPSLEDSPDPTEPEGTEEDPIVIDHSVEKPRDYSHLFKKRSFQGSQACVGTTPSASSMTPTSFLYKDKTLLAKIAERRRKKKEDEAIALAMPKSSPSLLTEERVQPVFEAAPPVLEAAQPVRTMLDGGRTAAYPDIYEKEAKAKALRRQYEAARKAAEKEREKEKEEKNNVEAGNEGKQEEEEKGEDNEEKKEHDQKEEKTERMDIMKNDNEIRDKTKEIDQKTEHFKMDCAKIRSHLATLKQNDFVEDYQKEKNMENQIRKIKNEAQKRRLDLEMKKKEDAKKDAKKYETIRKMKEETIKMEKETEKIRWESAKRELEKAKKEKEEKEKSLKKRRDEMEEEDRDDGGQPGPSNRLARQPSRIAVPPVRRASSISRKVKKELKEEKEKKKNLKRNLKMEDEDDSEDEDYLPGPSNRIVVKAKKSTPKKKASTPRMKKSKTAKIDDVYRKFYPNKSSRYSR